MARTAPLDYGSIPSSRVMPGEPVFADDWKQIALNGNHAYRYLNPAVISQDMKERVGEIVVILSAVPVLTSVWRIPVYPGHAGQTLGGTIWAFQAGGAGLDTGHYRFTSSAGNTTVNVVSPGGAVSWQPYSFSGLPLNTAGAPETITLEIWSTPGGGLSNTYLNSVDCWLEAGPDPIPAGNDGQDWYPQDTVTGAADQPLPTYRLDRLSANADQVCGMRPGVVMSYSGYFADAFRGAIYLTSSLRVIERIPVRYGPKTRWIKVYINGRCDNGAQVVSVWTGQTGFGAAQTVALPTVAAWTLAPTTSWVTVAVPVGPVASIGRTRIYVQGEGSVANPMDIYGVCAWEAM
jgi:hypothetical protein